MVGRDSDPGLMVLSFLDLFNVVSILNVEGQQQIDITCSYLEIYNEVGDLSACAETFCVH